MPVFVRVRRPGQPSQFAPWPLTDRQDSALTTLSSVGTAPAETWLSTKNPEEPNMTQIATETKEVGRYQHDDSRYDRTNLVHG